MASVIFSPELQRYTREEKASVDVATYRELIAELGGRYPEMDAEILLKMAVSIDGQITHDPLLEEIASDSEVIFLYRISGG
jgi:molybdopterin converting factor small subunit|tara:strand:+ start:423 stop:665 length:243 start_codon:yes stop_codon:yes gene_type:complete